MRAKLLNKKLLLGALGSVFLGVAATVGVMAAIPDSDTGVITACADNTTGAMRAIDAQASATCGGSETALSWSAHESSVLVLNFNLTAYENDDFAGDYNSTYSRNIISTYAIQPSNDPTSSGSYGLCVHVPFEAVVVSPHNALGFGTIDIPTLAGGAANINTMCGSGYNIYLAGQPSPFQEVSYYITN